MEGLLSTGLPSLVFNNHVILLGVYELLPRNISNVNKIKPTFMIKLL